MVKKINDESIIIKINDLLSKINHLNDINKEDSSEFEQKFSKLTENDVNALKIKYKEKYNLFKEQYKQFVLKYYEYDKLSKENFDIYNNECNLLKQLETYIEEKLKILKLNSSSDTDYIEYQNEYNSPTNIEIKGKEKEESENISTYMYFQKKKNLKNYYDNTTFNLNTDSSNYGQLITTIKADIKDRIECSQPQVEIVKKDIEVKFLINKEKYYDNFIIESDLYNNQDNDKQKIEILVISKYIKSSEPGLIPPENINKDSIDSNKFKNLNLYSDWRRKLCPDYIFEIIDSRGSYILPILIDNNYFASFYHFYYFSKFRNRHDIDGKKIEQYNKFADSLVLHGSNSRRFGEKNGHKSLLEIQSKIKSLGLLYNEDQDETNIVKKGLFAKFYQNEELKNILINTLDTLLIKDKFEKEKKKNKYSYNIDYNLMKIRYLIKNISYAKSRKQKICLHSKRQSSGKKSSS